MPFTDWNDCNKLTKVKLLKNKCEILIKKKYCVSTKFQALFQGLGLHHWPTVTAIFALMNHGSYSWARTHNK